MATATITKARAAPTVADLLERLGDISPHRVRLHPAPGTATEADVIAAHQEDGMRWELVEGTLVEKPMGYEEATLAMYLGYFIIRFLEDHNLGQVAGADATIRLLPGVVRMPDVLFVSRARRPQGEKRKAIPDLVPDLAVEILSQSNTPQEMRRKLREYFRAGVRLAWIVDPRKKTVRVHTTATRSTLLTEDDELDGGDVLPGFRLRIRDWFTRVE